MKQSETKKFFFIANGFCSKISGGDTHANLFVNFLSTKDHDVAICTPRNAFLGVFNPSVSIVTYKNLPFEHLMYSSNILLFCIYIYRIVMSVVKKQFYRADVIVLTSHLFHDTFVVPFLREKNIVCYVHHVIGQQRRVGFLGAATSLLERLSFFILKFKKVTIFTVSERVKKQLINFYGFSASNIFVSTNGVDVDFINRVQPRGRCFDLVFCGRLHMTKGIFDLLKIIEGLKEGNNNIRCAIMGSGPMEKEFKELVFKKNLEENIILLGHVSEVKKIEVMKSAKVFVLPSHEEGWGIVIAEAMVAGTPVVVYRLEDIIDIWKDNVVWSDYLDILDFTNKVDFLLKNKLEREKLSKKAYRYSQNLDWQSVLETEWKKVLSL